MIGVKVIPAAPHAGAIPGAVVNVKVPVAGIVATSVPVAEIGARETIAVAARVEPSTAILTFLRINTEYSHRQG